MSTVRIKQSSGVWSLIKWSVIISWRFFSGAHMSGKQYNDATWWRDASPMFRKRRQAYTWWRRKARMKRAGWRHSLFWITAILTAGFVWSTTFMLVSLAAIAPVGLWVAYGRIRYALFLPVVGNHSDGSVRQHWIMKPATRRVLTMVKKPKGMRKRPGVALRSEIKPGVHLREIPPELAGAIRREVAIELDGEPPVEMKLLMTPD